MSNFVDYTARVSVAGNPDLTNEEAKSWTVGAILRPRFLPRFNLAVDWVNIHLKNAITSLGGEDILAACYDATDFPSSYCDLIDRGSDGQVEFIREGYYNAARYDTQVLTVQMDYQQPLGGNWGTLGASLSYLYRDKLDTQVGTGDINHDAGEIGYPKHSATFNLTYLNQGFNLLWQTRYYGKGRFNLDEDEDARDILGVGDWWMFNATVGYDVNEDFGIKLIVDNVFDKKPPFPAIAGGGLNTYFSGVIGRYYRLSTSIKF